ncbi:MAG TPA: HDOD domain-containing protein [Planctomycetaceae bacterium]|jgi:HD-like signal output (HDOD) protein|nr:HDOD domain-containing protein [Planctomycetaceae bacterium]
MITSSANASDPEGHVRCPRFVAILRRERSQSLALAARLRESGIAAVDVESTVLLSKLVAAKLVELLIIDNQIEGFLTGMEVVQKMRIAFVRIPVIVLGSNVEMLRQESNVLGPITFADASKDTDEIGKIARRVLSRPPNDLDVIPERARVLVERQIDLPVLSQLVVRLVGYFQAPMDEIPVEEMCRDISIDPRATVVLFKAANASANGLLRQATTVRDAVRLLGVRRSIGHILNAAVVEGMGVLAQGLPVVDQAWHARRGMLIASASSTFAEEIERGHTETAFVSGLLQDVGILALLRAFPKDYRAVLQRWRSVGHLKLPIIERAALGCTHADVSAAMLERWQMPASLIVPVLHHLEPAQETARLGIDLGLHRVMTIGEAMADLIDAPHASRRHTLDILLAQYGPEEHTACREALMNATARAAEASRLLDLQLPPASELERLLRSALSTVPQPIHTELVAARRDGSSEPIQLDSP